MNTLQNPLAKITLLGQPLIKTMKLTRFHKYCFFFSLSLLSANIFLVSAVESGRNIEELDRSAVFSFAIMSDHKGLSPSDNERFAKMAKWIEKSGDRFVIGLGDHLKINRPNTFLDFMVENQWWNKNFYPNIADGENEFYGGSQDVWGKGGPLLIHQGLDKRPHIDIRGNGVEYYAKIPAQDYTIHLIQLHFPDHPRDDKLSFREDSKIYLEETLLNLDKGPKDIVIVAAHSISGFWMEIVSGKQKQLLADKCDLVLSATTHHFQRKKLAEYGDNGALIINTGSITYPDSDTYGSVAGYLQVHVLENPLRLDVKFLNIDMDKRQLPNREYAFTKIVGGRTSYTLPDDD